MLNKHIVMKCGHIADCIIHDVPYHNDKISLEACSSCFDQLGTAIQPACTMNEDQLDEPLPKIEREYGAVLVGGFVVIFLSIAILIASISQ